MGCRKRGRWGVWGVGRGQLGHRKRGSWGVGRGAGGV